MESKIFSFSILEFTKFSPEIQAINKIRKIV